MKKIYFLPLLVCFLVSIQTFAQINLSGTGYTQNFDGIASGLPAGFSVRTGATATSLGTEQVLTTTATAWSNTGGGFRNFASADGLTSTSTSTVQSGSTDRALGVRQTSSFGDPGSAFTIQLANTTGFTNFQLTFKLQSLDALSPRIATWLVQYGTGSAPTSFTTITTIPASLTSGSSTFSNADVTVNFGAALDNISDVVWIRIVTLSATTGSGNRPTTAIDDLSLNYTPAGSDVTAPTINSLSPQNNATNVALNTTASINFSEAIQKGTGNIYVKKSSDNSLVQTIDVTSSAVTVSGNSASFNLSLASSTQYYIEADAGSFKDGSNNPFAGISGSSVWSFTTLTPVETISVATGTNASEPSTNGSFTISFSAPTTASTNLDFAFTGTAGFGSDYTVSYSAGSTTSTTSNGTLTIPAGTSSITVTITPIDDAVVENAEGITLTLSNPGTGYILGTSSANINLTDNDLAQVTVAAGINASEPSTNGTFTFNLSTPAPAGGVTITYSLNGSTSLNNDYTDPNNGTITIAEGNTTATLILNVTDDAQFEGTETIILTLNSANNGFVISGNTATINLLDNEKPKVVINQVYGGGGNSGSTYKNDFIELYNNENVPVNLAGWSVQYSSATGTGNWTVTPLTGVIPAHGFYLVQEAAGSGGTTNLPTPDDAGSIAMGSGSGKVLLSTSVTPLSGANPTTSVVVDKVGYGSTATGFETAPTTGPGDNTVSVKRKIDGADSDNNSTDFALSTVEPRNKLYTTTAPVVASLTPPTNSIGVPYNSATTIVFDKTVVKGSGNITIYENGVALPSIDVNSSAISISNNRTVTIDFTYTPGKSYYINVDGTAFHDLYGNNFAGISNNTTWNFSTFNSTAAVALPANFDFQNCTGTGLLPNGFTQFSETGSVVWDCTPFGRDPAAPAGTAQFPNAVQINGFVNGTNSANIDWLISPTLDLTGSTYPLLSFWSRTAFNGLPLQLKISTDYPGTGDPRNYTWTDLNGKFPPQTSNVWTLSSDINLAAFKQANVHIAFIYTSSDDDGARWTIDDISIVNSATPPPPSLTVGVSDIQFGFVANGSNGDKTFSFIGNDLTEDVTLSSDGAFLLSKDGTSFSSSITYTVAEANNISETVYARFAPTQADQNFAGTITVTTTGNIRTITTKGTSIDPATTLEVVNWNMEWFGSTTMAPNNDDQQEQNAETILKNVGADIFGLVEVVDETRFARVVSHMPGYSYVIGNFGSHVNPPDPSGGSLGDAQKLAFVYKTSLFSNVRTRALINNQNINSTSYKNWSSGRYPFLMTADVTLNGVTKTINFVLVHAKANTSPTSDSYARRQASAQELHDTLMQYFANENIIMLGDFNDDLDQSITAGFTTTSYSSFTTDQANFFSPTLALSLAGKKSTVSYNDMIDHVMLSNDMQPWYMPGSATVLSDVSSLVTNYGSTTTDHYPVFTRYMFCKLTPPSDITVSNDKGQCGAIVNFNAAGTMTCGTVTAAPASGSFFPLGTTTVQLTASTGETASFKVTVKDDEKPTITAPANITVNADAGQCSIVKENVTLGNPVFNDNCEGSTVTNDAPAVFNVGTTTVTWTVTDAAGNTETATQLVTVEDHELPAITAPADLSVKAAAGKCSATVSLGSTQTSDNCGVASVANDGPEDGVYSVGTHTITWTVTDIHGNTASATQTIIVSDDQKPTITAPAAITINADGGKCYATNVSLGSPVTNDNCGVQSVSNDAPMQFPVGTTIVTWTVVDIHGNSATAIQNVTVIDNQKPIITAPAAITVHPNNAGCTAKNVSLGNATATDNCEIASITNNAPATFPVGTTTVTWTATDINGNTATTTQTVTVTVDPAMSSSIPDVYAVSPGGDANTIYVGYGPSSVTLNAVVNGGAGGYAYKWTIGSSAGQALNSTASYTVSPTATTTYYLNVKDMYGCSAPVTTKTIYVTDVRCGSRMDKVSVCTSSKGKQNTSCLATKDVAAALSSGGHLGSCETSGTQKPITVTGYPNPSFNYFTISLENGDPSEKISLRVMDIFGRVVEQKNNLQTNSAIQIGKNYWPGLYFVEVIQGNVHQQLKLLKL